MSVVALSSMVFVGCSKPPDKAMKDARNALNSASARSECAPEKYSAAQGLFKEAQALIKAEKYEEAERKALAAKRLAAQARKEADANWEECQRRKAALAKANQPVKKDDQPTTDPNSKDNKATLSTVYFAYDSSEISDAQRSILEENARWMRQNPKKSVTLEGHTDERGSVEYNLALGERRAGQVRKYLVQLGIDASRLRVLSYGEEKPAAFGSSNDDFRQNRRVEFAPSK